MKHWKLVVGPLLILAQAPNLSIDAASPGRLLGQTAVLCLGAVLIVRGVRELRR
jgi:hypothetical protein